MTTDTTTSTHTPGPWTVDFGSGDGSIINIKDERGAQVCRMARGAMMIPRARFIVDAPATAAERDRLAAINADLLAALRDVLAAYAPHMQRTVDREGEDALHPAVKQARAAIARATGGEG